MVGTCVEVQLPGAMNAWGRNIHRAINLHGSMGVLKHGIAIDVSMKFEKQGVLDLIIMYIHSRGLL